MIITGLFFAEYARVSEDILSTGGPWRALGFASPSTDAGRPGRGLSAVTSPHRRLDRLEVSIPAAIKDLVFSPSNDAAQAREAAIIAVARLEADFGEHLAPLADFLLRSESVASRVALRKEVRVAVDVRRINYRQIPKL